MLTFRDALVSVLAPCMTVARLTCRPRGGAAWLVVLALAAGCADERPSWTERNQRVIDEHKISAICRGSPSP